MSGEDTLLQSDGREAREGVVKKGSERESRNRWVILTADDKPASRSADKEREREKERESKAI